MIVTKFGGSSLASAEQFKKVETIIAADTKRRIVVVSAPGKRYKDDIKVTDLLIKAGEKALRNQDFTRELSAILERYAEIAEGLGLGERGMRQIEDTIVSVLEDETNDSGLFMDRIKACGEDSCARLMSEYLESKGHDAAYIPPDEAGIFVSDESGNARVLDKTFTELKKLKARQEVLVVPGFFGYTPAGKLVTFPRGGSDITGSIVAAGVEADLYENFTDVDSVFAANPGIVENPAEIEELTYREMRELSYAGFSVFHDEALIPAFKAGIPVSIKNTNNPAAPGTSILKNRKLTGKPVVGIASDDGFAMIYVSKYLMNREIGFGRRLLQILEDYKISYEHTPSGIDDISIIIREDQLDMIKEHNVIKRIQDELEVDDISVEKNLAMIMLVGEGMTSTVGIAARAASAFSRAKVNIEMINQGSSEVSMMYGVKADNEAAAVRSLYEEFFTDQDGFPARSPSPGAIEVNAFE
ncbi:aspartate kinase [Bacillus marinisedimentorum]|uniref:aspartate kinase n=1 Tax=Bacillus marinisedimentorum TaxID=1821260 RepID=UPI0007E1F2CB|nr:aspartate kinase [Bacillus marinisedimentorum]